MTTTCLSDSQLQLAARDGPISVPALGLGCWSWGDDKGVWGWDAYDKTLTRASIEKAFITAVDAGVRLFDTAETYGGGLSEQILGELVRKHPLREKLLIATKFQPGKWSQTGIPVRKAMVQAARESTRRLGISQLALFQIHAPLHPASFEEQGHGLADVVEEGWRAPWASRTLRSRRWCRCMRHWPRAACHSRPTRSNSRCCAPSRRRVASSPSAHGSACDSSPTRRSPVRRAPH